MKSLRSRQLGSAIGFALFVGFAGTVCGQPCSEMVSPAFGPADFAGDAFAFAQLDEDGNGGNPPVLIAGGAFLRAGGEPARRLARWDGNAWSEFGGGANGAVNTLFIWDSDGTGPLPSQLHAGGDFSEIGGQPISGIARWDGTQWQPLGTGIPGGGVLAMEAFVETIGGVSRLRLFVGGYFGSAGGVSGTGSIARWDGNIWSAVGTPGSVQSAEKLVVFNPGGVTGQTRLHALHSNNAISAWNGSSWSTVFGGGGPSSIDDLVIHDADGSGPLNPRLVASGSVLIPGQGSVRNQAIEWNGQTWSSLGATQIGSIYRIASFDPDGIGPATPMLIACGNVALETGEIVPLAGRSGTTWTQFADVDDAVSGFGVYDPDGSGPVRGKLLVNGYFAHVNDVSMPRLAAWDGQEWTAIGGPNPGNGLSRWAQSIVAFDADGDGPAQPAPYVGGPFAIVGNQSSLVYRLQGDQWTEAAPAPGAFRAQAMHDPDGNGPSAPGLFVQGRVSDEEVLQYLDADGWHSLPWPYSSGSARGVSYDEFNDDEIPPLLIFGGYLFVEPNSPGLAAWDGNTWFRFGGQVNSSILAMTIFEPPDTSSPAQLIIGGFLSSAGGTSVRNVAMWNGAAWQAMGAGVNFPARALCTFDRDGDGPLPNEVIVGGQFTMAGGQPASGIARWDGAAWHPIGSGVQGTVWALTTWDIDGAGGDPPVLVAGGSFYQVDGIAASNIAYWDGISWSPLGQGADARVWELAVGNEHGPLGPQTLYASGDFVTMDGVPSERFARIVCPAPVCTGDVNGDRVVDLADLAILLGNFGTLSGGTLEGGDVNSDGAVDIQDLALLLAAFGTTCG